MIGFYFSISSLIIMILLSIVFHTKERVINKETQVYGYLLFGSIHVLRNYENLNHKDHIAIHYN